MNLAPVRLAKSGGGGWPVASIVAALTLLVFWPALANGFVRWDDGETIVVNEHLRGLDTATIEWAFTTFHMGHYQPLSWLSLALDRELWGLNPRGYHLTALLLHAVNALLCFGLARRLLAPGGGAGSARAPGALAAVAALLFALHPLRVESVAWATERRDVLSATLCFAAVLAYLRAHQDERSDAGRKRWLAVAFGASLLAVMAKAVGPLLLAVLVLLDYWPLKRIAGRGAGERWWKPWVEKLPWVLLAGASAFLAIQAQSRTGAMADAAHYPALARAAALVRGLAFYPLATLWPNDLAPLYEVPHGGLTADGRFAGAASFVAAATLAALASLRRRPAVAVAWGSYLAAVVPVSGPFQSGPQWAADRYSYLSCVGLVLLAVAAGWGWLRARPQGWSRAALAGACAALLGLSLVTRRQIAIWHDSMSLWNAAIERYPQASVAYSNRAVEWVERGDWPRAEADLRQALRLYPPYPDAWINLAYVRAQAGAWQESAEAALRGLELRKDDPTGLAHLGTARMNLGDALGALEAYERVAVVAPGAADAHLKRASLLDLLGRREEALAAARRAAELRPDQALPRIFLASLLELAGKPTEALLEAQRALAVDPGSDEARELVKRLGGGPAPPGAGR